MSDDFKAKVTADTAQAESDIEKLIKKYEGKKVKLNVETGKDATKQLQNASSAANSLNNSMGNVARTTLAATASYKAFNLATQQLKEAVKEVEALNSALITVRMTMADMTGADLSNLKSQILDMSNQLSTYAQTVSDAAQIYANANESISSIMLKAEPTVLLATAANTSASTAADTVQGILNQFHLTDEAAMGVVDTLEGLSAEMRMDFAKGIDNVAQAVKVSGSVIDSAGMSFEKYASIVSATAESTRQSGSVLGNAFKTIASRVGRSIDGETTDADKSNAEKAFNSVGVSVRGADGDIRNLSDTLDDLSKVWGNLNRAQQNYVAEQAAGVRQVSIFKNMMDNYSRSLELEQVALNSSGMAMQVNETRAESINGKLQKLSSTMTKLYNDAVSEEAIMSVLDFADGLAKVADNLGLLKGAFAALGAAGIAKGVSLIASNWQTLVGLFTSPVGLAVAGVGAAVSIYSALKKKQEELMQSAREAGTAWEDNTDALQGNIDTITELKEQLESGNLTEEESYNVKSQLLDIQNQLIDTYGQQANGIDLVNGSLETQLGLIKQLSEEEAKKYLNENKQGIDEATKQMEKDRSYKLGIYQDDNLQRLKAVKESINNNKLTSDLFDDGSIRISFDGTATDAYEALSSFASDLRNIENKYGESEGIEILLNKLEGKINDAKGILDDYQDIYQTANLSKLSTDNTKIETSYGGSKSYSDVAKDYTDAISEYNEALLNIDDAEALDKAEAKFNAVQAAVDQIVASVPGYATVFEGFREELNEAAVKTVSLNDALEDGSTKGLKSYADKLKELGLNDKEFVSSLNDADSATGQLSNALVDAAQSAGLIGDSDAEVQKLVDALINAGIIAGQVADKAGEVQDAFNINATPLLDAYNAATESTNEGDSYLKFAEALEKAKEAYNDGLIGTDDFKTAAAMFSPTGMDDAANFEENYNRIKKYFDADSAKGVQEFLKDLEALDKGYAKFDESTGTWTTDFDDLEQAALDMGMGFEPFMSVLKRMDDYGASNNFFSNTEEGMEHLTELYSELAVEEMKLAQLKQTDPNNQTAIDATQDKINTLKSSIQESIGYLEQLTNMQAKDFDTQVTGAKEAYSALKEQQAKVISEGGVNAQSVADMIQDQMDTLATQYHLQIDAEGNIIEVKQPDETPQVNVEAVAQVSGGQSTSTANVVAFADTTQADTKIQETVDKADESTGTIKIDGDSSPAKTKTDDAVNDIDLRTGYIKVDANTDKLDETIRNALAGKTYKVNVQPNAGGSTVKPVEQRANGTPFIKSATFNNGYIGHAFASGGTVGEPRDTIALTGELGEELIVRGDRFITVGKKGAEMAHLKKGDIVFNAEQTKALLSRGRINGRGRALAQGNARAGVGTNSLTFQGGAAGNKLGDDTSDQNNTKEKEKNTEAVKHSTQVFDWVAVRLEYFANKTKKIADTITDYVTNVFKKAQLSKQMKAIKKEITANTKGATAYLNKANSVAKKYVYYDDDGGKHSVSVSAKYKKLVQQGKWSIEDMDTSTDRKAALAEAIQSYQDYYQKYLDCKQAVIDLRNEQLELYEDWVNIPTDTAEKKVEKLDTSLKQLELTYTKLGGYNVSAMNSNLDQQTANIKQQYETYQTALAEANKNATSANKILSNKKNAFTDKQIKKLSESQQSALANGTEISTTGITDKALLKKINAYNQALQKSTIAANAQAEALNNAIEAEQNYTETVQENAQAKFDNIQTMYENVLSTIEHNKNLIDAQINRMETMGHLISKKYYETLRNTEASNLAELQKERDDLVASLNEAVESGAIKKDSEPWYEMQGKINDVTLSIEDATTAMIEYNNSIRDIDWQIFDLLQERISFVSNEAEFLISLMENDKLYEDSGQLTDKGMSTMGLHGLNYNVAMTQADKYAEKVKELNEELEKDPYDQDVIDKRNEYLEQQQEMILAAENEKQAIVDMVREGIEMELDALKELIDARNEALSSQEDLYDYQKNIKKQAEEIASLEKQLSAYAGDTSEESRAKIQQIKVDLEDARENLQETEYDHYISDQKKLLDDLYDEYEDILNKRLDDVDTLISDMITQTNDNSKQIDSTIIEKAESVGYELSEQMLSIWKTGDGNISSVLTTYGDSFNTALTTTNATLGNIYTDIQKMVAYLDEQAKTNTGSTGDAGNTGQSGNAGTTSSNTVQQVVQAVQNAVNSSNFNSNSVNSGSSISGGNGVLYSSGDAVIEGVATESSSLKKAKQFIRKLDSKKLTDEALKKHSSLFQYIYKKSNNKNITNDKILELGNLLKVTGLPKKADKLTSANKSAVLKKLKVVGYKNGTRYVPDNGFAWTQEEGEEVIIRRSDGAILTPLGQGDMVANADATSNLYDFMNNPAKFVNSLVPSIPMPEHKSVQESYKVDFGDINMNFPNVKNYEEMLYALKHDKRFEDTVQSMTTDRIFGKSALRKYK